MGGAVGAAAAAAAAMARATKASGVIVRMEPEGFARILQRQERPLVVQARGGIPWSKHYQYLTSYKGLAFFTKSPTPLSLPGSCELVVAERIWIPG